MRGIQINRRGEFSCSEDEDEGLMMDDDPMYEDDDFVMWSASPQGSVMWIEMVWSEPI